MPEEFHWFERGRRPPKVRVAPSGLAFNLSAANLLSGAGRVLLGLDVKRKLLVVRPSPDGDERALPLRRTRDGARVYSRGFFRFLKARFPDLPGEAFTLPARWDAGRGLLAAGLSKSESPRGRAGGGGRRGSGKPEERVGAPVPPEAAEKAAEELIRRIQGHELPDEFTLRELYRHRWNLLDRKDLAEAACEELVEAGWLKKRPAEKGRARVIYRVDPGKREPGRAREAPEEAAGGG